ncbi:hypothetical protein K491DRAFT_681468 [Lophiostoma macrostomum CBS 122681]|uniref:Uncharacterized protein n=1 Tax=Lophiostoma macrostomum CBS 122681 TaxID=1314788 RepID=A0A6A6SZC6_9PLEO|nr:hypothetical protein K491DRAFT_681468 [Lophiostoma macrostomum CBS 122681]
MAYSHPMQTYLETIPSLHPKVDFPYPHSGPHDESGRSEPPEPIPSAPNKAPRSTTLAPCLSPSPLPTSPTQAAGQESTALDSAPPMLREWCRSHGLGVVAMPGNLARGGGGVTIDG